MSTMIGYITGNILAIEDTRIIIDTGGVGYELYCPVAGHTLVLGEKVEFWVYTSVRENAIELFGFAQPQELSFFKLLLSVSGIGPKGALSIISAAPIETLGASIASGNAEILNRVPGIGKKTAERIIVELKDKMPTTIGDVPELTTNDNELIDTLKQLGYRDREIENVLPELEADSESPLEIRLANALRLFGSK